jgi:predicted short-subunit dehydrogenase-like oxidoreductase (DUF2520 family)
MVISIYGSGNVAYVLGRLIVKSGHQVYQIIARNEIAGNALAKELNATFTKPTENIEKVDFVIVCISDSALPETLHESDFNKNTILNTAGSLSQHILRNFADNYGVIYPLQSLNKERDMHTEIPFLLEANSDKIFKQLDLFAATLSNAHIYMEEEKRFKIHAAAVIASNFTNYMYKVAFDFCQNENIDFNLLTPLIIETAERIKNHNPADVQTGPAKRHDYATLEKHLRILTDYPKIRTLYTRITDGIMND